MTSDETHLTSELPEWMTGYDREEDLVGKNMSTGVLLGGSGVTNYEFPENDRPTKLLTGPVPGSWIVFKEALFKLMTHHISAVAIMSSNLYMIQQGIETLPAITYSIVRARPIGSDRKRIRRIEPASPNVPGAQLRTWGRDVHYLVQFNCWAENEADADWTVFKLHDFFERNLDSIQDMAVSCTWMEDLTDIEIVRLGLPYSVRSAQYAFEMPHLDAEYISEIGSIHVVLPKNSLTEGD